MIDAENFPLHAVGSQTFLLNFEAGSQIFPLHDAAASQILLLHDAAASQIFLLHDAAGNQFGSGESSLKTLEDSLGT